MKADSSSPTELIDSLPSAENIFATQSYVLFACAVASILKASNMREGAGLGDSKEAIDLI